MTRVATPLAVLLVALALAAPGRAQDDPTELWSEFPLVPKIEQPASSPAGPLLPPRDEASPVADDSSGSNYWLPVLAVAAVALLLGTRLVRQVSPTDGYVLGDRVGALRGRARQLRTRPTRRRPIRSAHRKRTARRAVQYATAEPVDEVVVEVETPSPHVDERDAPGPVPFITRRSYIERNKGEWERWWPSYVKRGREAWATDDLHWGIWGIPESDLRLVDGLETGADVIELGCGTAAICAWLARRGFRPIGVDITRPLLETAAEFEREFRVRFPLLCANAEQLHFEDASFDCAISEYGASLWCDPHRWVAEAARLLRPNGLLVFVTNSALLVSCMPNDRGVAGDRLVRDYFSRYRVEFEGTDAIEFHLNHGDWVRLLRTNGFVIEGLVETRPPEGATPRFPFVSAEWAQHRPSEDIWVARKAPRPSFSDDGSETEALAAGHDFPRPPEDPALASHLRIEERELGRVR